MEPGLKQLFPTHIDSPSAMVEFGKSLAPCLTPGDVLALIGNLGSGKTHLTQGIVQYFDYPDTVTSPTFGLIHEYTGTPIIHADLYRMKQAEELLAIGWEDYLEHDAILVIEWAERFPQLMPDGTHWIKIDYSKPSGRDLSYTRY